MPRDMFPFRIFSMPPQLQANPAWTDSYGAANWRTFQVWTGQAVAWQIMEPGSGAPADTQVAVPQLVYVARTSGYNNAGQTSGGNAAVANVSIVNENYNEYYAAQKLGNYPSNPMNPDGTGPQDYPNAYNELVFTAPPCCVAVFWVSWDVNSVGPDEYDSALLGESYAAFPVLHFGWLSASGEYGGDLDDTNGPDILGFLASDYNGSPSQIYPYIPSNALDGDFSTGTQTPEGTVIIGAIQVGALGAVSNTGNDGICQIFQCQFDNLLSPMQRIQFRGTYDDSTWYYPSEITAESSDGASSLFINATPFALYDYDPYENQSNSPLTDGVNYTTYQNLWMPLGGTSNGGGTFLMNVVAEQNNYVQCTYASNNAAVNVAKPWPLRGFTASTNDSQGANQKIDPPYANSGANGFLVAYIPVGGTGVNIGNTALTLLDSNEYPRILKTRLTTCENINGTQTNSSRYFDCTTYNT